MYYELHKGYKHRIFLKYSQVSLISFTSNFNHSQIFLAGNDLYISSIVLKHSQSALKLSIPIFLSISCANVFSSNFIAQSSSQVTLILLELYQDSQIFSIRTDNFVFSSILSVQLRLPSLKIFSITVGLSSWVTQILGEMSYSTY